MPAKDSILNYLAALKAKFDIGAVKKEEIGPATKTKGSTIRNALAALKKDGLVVVDGKMLVITSKGMGEADTSSFGNIKIATTNEEKHNMIKEELTSDKQRQLFDALADGHIYNKEELRVSLGYGKNSTWRNLIASLVKVKVAEYPSQKTIQLTKSMFPIVPRPE